MAQTASAPQNAPPWVVRQPPLSSLSKSGGWCFAESEAEAVDLAHSIARANPGLIVGVYALDRQFRAGVSDPVEVPIPAPVSAPA